MFIRHSKASSSITGARVRHVSTSLAGKSISSSSIPKLAPGESREQRTVKFDRNGRTSTVQLTSVRRMSDFARTKGSNVGNWWSEEGSPAAKATESEPSPYAYEPHSVYLLESRYPVRYGVGRVEAPEHVVGICRASDFEAVVKMYNSLEAPREGLTAMDNARWPWTKSPATESEKLYVAKEDSEGGDGSSSVSMEDSLRQMSSDEGWQAALQKDARRHMAQTIAVAERVSEENLTDLPDTRMKRWEGKIPFEVELDDGTVEHPSGYIPPTAVHKFGDADHYSRAHTPTAARARAAEIKSLEHHSDPSVQIRQWEAVKEREEEEGLLMSRLRDGILAGGVSAATEPKESKIPIEIHGVHIDAVAQPMQHPSGFIPPTAGMARGEKDARTEVLPGQHIPSELPTAEERPPTFSSSDSPLEHADTAALETDDVESSVERSLSRSGSQALINRFDEPLREIRRKYATHIHEEPFWRPLLSFTVSTRPLALTLARLSENLEKGLPSHAAISQYSGNDNVPARMRDIRLERMRMLGLELSKLLAGGARSGFAGIRFAPREKGRHLTVDGEDRPIEWERRVVGVGIGEWNPLAPQLKEFFQKDATQSVQQVLNDPEDGAPFLVYGIDEHGHPTENVEGPWESMMLQDNVKNDTIKILQEIQALQQWLTGKNLHARIFVPKFYGEGYTPLKHEMEVAEGRLPIILANDGEAPPEGHIEISGPRARRFVNERIQKLYEQNQDIIAATVSIRHKSVTYPKKSQSFEEE